MTSSDQSAPSYQELAALVVEQAATITHLRSELEKANKRIAELESRLGQNSANSSKPPSSDGLVKPAPKSQRRRTGRTPGGQDGHQGRTRTQSLEPDHVLEHRPTPAPGAGWAWPGPSRPRWCAARSWTCPPSPPR